MSSGDLEIRPEATASASLRPRLDNIDLVRGLVMVLMALDHVRDFFHSDFLHQMDPSDITKVTPVLFFTRWVTHFCAPTFIFLTGTGAFLTGIRGQTTGMLARFLLVRGLWLLLLEATIIRLGWSFNVDYLKEFGGGVIFAIGYCMIVLSFLVWLPGAFIGVVGVSIIALHNLLDEVTAASSGLPGWLWILLHQPGGFTLFADFLGTGRPLGFGTGYCLLPWLGVMCSGYAFGAIFMLDRATRVRQLYGIGLGLILVFVALRFHNGYGDPPSSSPGTAGRWSVHAEVLPTVCSFLNCSKYPASLLFVLMTLGPAIILMAVFDRPIGALLRPLVIFGRVPLFYYLLHIPLIHGLRVGLDCALYGWSPFRNNAPWTVDASRLPPDYGHDLWFVYVVWLIVILLLFPLCKWFAGLKQKSRASWLSYF